MGEERKLIVYWKHFTMSKDNLKKGSFDSKRYQVELRSSEFPDSTSVDVATRQIKDEFGERMSFLPIPGGGHQFAEITGWTLAKVHKPEPVKSEKFEETKLF